MSEIPGTGTLQRDAPEASAVFSSRMIARSNVCSREGAWIVCACLVVCVILPIPSRAANGNRALSQFTHTAWTAKDGIPGPVRAIAQTQDGYLWLGTGAGLYRFDGVRFVQWQPAYGERLPADCIEALHTAKDGSLWIGFGAGGIARLYEGHLTTYLPSRDVPDGRILSIVSDHSGAVWIGGQYGFSRFLDGKWKRVGAAEGYPAPAAQSLFVDHSGTLWVATDGFDFHLSQNPTRPNTVLFLSPGAEHFRSTGMAFGQVTQIAEAPDGSVWAADTNGHAAKHLSPSSGQESLHVVDDEVTCLLFGSDQSLWIGLIEHGLRRVVDLKANRAASLDRFQPGDGLSNGQVYSVLRDREGNIWFATGGGVDRFRQDKFIPFSTREGLVPEIGIALTSTSDGSVWTISYTQDSVQRFHNNRLNELKLARYSPTDNTRILSLYADSDGSLWLGGSFGVAHGSNGHFNFVRYPGLLPLAMVEAITKDASGHLWVTASNSSTVGTIFRLEGQVWTDVRKRFDLPHFRCRVLYADRSGRVWFGFENGEVAVYERNGFRVYSTKDGLPGGKILSINNDSYGNLWIGSEGGLSRFEAGHFTTLTKENGLPGNSVSAIVEDDDGLFWIAGGLGILRVAPRELQEALRSRSYRMQGLQLDGRDGLRGLPRHHEPFPIATKGADGRLWFATMEGVAVIDPRHMPMNMLAPHVTFEEVKADDVAIPGASGVRLRPGTRSLQFKFAAPSLTAPERVEFRYRLEGFDHNWNGPVPDRSAIYTNVPPGSYRFRVIACNNDGVWNEEGAAIDFVIPPTFMQSSLFKVLCLAALLGFVWLAYRFRVRQVTGQLRTRIYDRTAERERIARDLHDTFFQSIQGLVLRFHTAASRVQVGHPARKMFDEALEQSDEVLAEGRKLLVHLHVTSSKPNDLPTSLAEFGERMQEGASVNFKVAVNGNTRALHPIIFEELTRIGREALSNAFRHSGARTIEAELNYETSELRIRIRDDGHGIEGDIVQRGYRDEHFGLPGMRERARKIGAHLELWSRAGAGTEIDLRIPATLGYLSHNGWVLARLRRFWCGTKQEDNDSSRAPGAAVR